VAADNLNPGRAVARPEQERGHGEQDAGHPVGAGDHRLAPEGVEQRSQQPRTVGPQGQPDETKAYPVDPGKPFYFRKPCPKNRFPAGFTSSGSRL
jgi:hypothetical protein